MDNELLLLSKNDIPFVEAQISIHQPTINEIALIGEETFFSAIQIILFNKNILSDKDKVDLSDKSDFDIFMSMMCSKEQAQLKNNVLMLFTLLFPKFMVKITGSEIILISEETSTRINTLNFDNFKDIINSMFSFEESGGGDGYNPADKRAAKIAEKLNKHKEKIAKIKGEDKKKVAIFSRYVSILSVGLQKDMNDLMNYTVFQLKDEMKRYQMKQSFDMYVQAKMAGAKDLDEVDNWMDDIHS